MQHTLGPCLTCRRDHRPRVILGVAGMHDQGLTHFYSDSDLSFECGPLNFARRVVIVIIQAAFTYCDSATRDGGMDQGHIARSIKTGRLVRVHAGRPVDEAIVVAGDSFRGIAGIENGSDADDALSAQGAGALYYRVAVAFERVVAEVRVAVEEVREPVVVWRGHLRSIQRRIGPAT